MLTVVHYKALQTSGIFSVCLTETSSPALAAKLSRPLQGKHLPPAEPGETSRVNSRLCLYLNGVIPQPHRLRVHRHVATLPSKRLSVSPLHRCLPLNYWKEREPELIPKRLFPVPQFTPPKRDSLQQRYYRPTTETITRLCTEGCTRYLDMRPATAH